jgi:hypothetical protein
MLDGSLLGGEHRQIDGAGHSRATLPLALAGTAARLARAPCQLARAVLAKLLHLVAPVTALVSDELQQPVEPQETLCGMYLDRAPRAPAPAVTVPRH